MNIRPKEIFPPRIQVETYETLTAARRAEEAKAAADSGTDKAAPAVTEKENG